MMIIIIGVYCGVPQGQLSLNVHHQRKHCHENPPNRGGGAQARPPVSGEKSWQILCGWLIFTRNCPFGTPQYTPISTQHTHSTISWWHGLFIIWGLLFCSCFPVWGSCFQLKTKCGQFVNHFGGCLVYPTARLLGIRPQEHF
jgi:hypothetical protein